MTAKAAIGNVAEEAIGNYRTVKAFASEKDEIEKFHKVNLEAYTAGKSIAVVMGL